MSPHPDPGSAAVPARAENLGFWAPLSQEPQLHGACSCLPRRVGPDPDAFCHPELPERAREVACGEVTTAASLLAALLPSSSAVCGSLVLFTGPSSLPGRSCFSSVVRRGKLRLAGTFLQFPFVRGAGCVSRGQLMEREGVGRPSSLQALQGRLWGLLSPGAPPLPLTMSPQTPTGGWA